MLKKRIIPCLDVCDGKVVKGIQFRDHEIVGDILDLARYYSDATADELVFYDISASTEGRLVNKSWVKTIAREVDIPFCVAGGIKTIADAETILANGADKVSINSPALANPDLINQLASRFGSQCVVVGIDTLVKDGQYLVYQYTGDVSKTVVTNKQLIQWALEVEERGAGEIVLNCMNKDGVRQGYDIEQCALLSKSVNIPVVASGGAGAIEHFLDVFTNTQVSGALAASIFHKKTICIKELKNYLAQRKIAVRL